MQNSEPRFTVQPADLPLDPVPTFFEDLATLGFENPSSVDENYDCASKQKNWIKPSQLTQALRLGFKIPSLFNHSTPKSCPFSFCLDFSYPLNSWWFDTPALPASNLDVAQEGARIWGFLTTRERKRSIHKHQTSWCEPQVREWYNDSHGCMTFTILKFDFKGWAKEQVFPSDDHLTIFTSDHVLRHGEPCLGVFGWFLATGKLGEILMNTSLQHLGILKSH